MTTFWQPLRAATDGTGEPGGAELCEVLQETLRESGVGSDPSAIVVLTRLKSRVYRLTVAEAGRNVSFVLKRYDPWMARRNELVLHRWLPALGMSDRSPRLVATAAERRGRCVWHAYDDLGEMSVTVEHANRRAVLAAIELIAELHTRAAGHVLLPACRHYCGDLGAPFIKANVRDAIAVLEGMVPGRLNMTPEHGALRDRLLARLHQLREELPWRLQILHEEGGPETLLHGDLWTTNTIVVPTADGLSARFIDWDHAAVGPASYDLSTFLYRFPPAERAWILDAYASAVGRGGWRLAGEHNLNVLFETAEYARCANRVIWPAAALLEEGAEWGWITLAEVERWFAAMAPPLMV